MNKKNVILAVDDEPINLFLLSELLEEEYALITAENGRACLKLLETQSPDLILLDVSMPEMDGYEVCRQIKTQEKFMNTPVFFLTARTQLKDELKGLELGAIDYISKPFSGDILLSRIKTHIKLLNTSKQLAYEKDRVGAIVNKIKSDNRFSDQNLHYYTRGMEDTSGDVVYSAKIGTDKQLFLIGDFTGHGLAAAVCGSVVSTIFYTLSLFGNDGQKICTVLNEELLHKLPAYMFLAAVMLEVDYSKQTVKVWNFAMPEVLHAKHHGENVFYPSQFLPLGVMPDVLEGQLPDEFRIASKDSLYVMSDGLTEAQNHQGEMLGDAVLIDFINSSYFKEKRQVSALEDYLKEKAPTAFEKDDITLVEVRLP